MPRPDAAVKARRIYHARLRRVFQQPACTDSRIAVTMLIHTELNRHKQFPLFLHVFYYGENIFHIMKCLKNQDIRTGLRQCIGDQPVFPVNLVFLPSYAVRQRAYVSCQKTVLPRHSPAFRRCLKCIFKSSPYIFPQFLFPAAKCPSVSGKSIGAQQYRPGLQILPMYLPHPRRMGPIKTLRQFLYPIFVCKICPESPVTYYLSLFQIILYFHPVSLFCHMFPRIA